MLNIRRLLSDTQGEGDSAAGDGPGRRDSGAEGHVHLPATGGGGQDEEAQKGGQPIEGLQTLIVWF